MKIVIQFLFNGDKEISAETGVEGDVIDLLLPTVGDLVEHSSISGVPFRGRVTDRIFSYHLPSGKRLVQGSIVIKLCLDRATIVH